jgi:hypothetical protein
LGKAVKSPLFPSDLRQLSQKPKFWESLKKHRKPRRFAAGPAAHSRCQGIAALDTSAGACETTNRVVEQAH